MEPKEKKNLTQTTTNTAALEEHGIICAVKMTKTLIKHNTAKLDRYLFIITLQHQAVVATASLLYSHYSITFISPATQLHLTWRVDLSLVIYL